MPENHLVIYVLKNGEQQGPYDAASINSLLRSGVLAPDQLAWHEGLDEWIPLSSASSY
jgi:hypothetical protein